MDGGVGRIGADDGERRGVGVVDAAIGHGLVVARSGPVRGGRPFADVVSMVLHV